MRLILLCALFFVGCGGKVTQEVRPTPPPPDTLGTITFSWGASCDSTWYPWHISLYDGVVVDTFTLTSNRVVYCGGLDQYTVERIYHRTRPIVIHIIRDDHGLNILRTYPRQDTVAAWPVCDKLPELLRCGPSTVWQCDGTGVTCNTWPQNIWGCR